jgi:branched-chain amino acid transport system substrate-binding protein
MIAKLQSQTLLDYTRQYKRLAMVSDNTPTAQTIADGWRKSLKENGVELVADELIPVGAPDMVAQLQKIAAANPDGVLIQGQDSGAISLFFKGVKQLNLKFDLIGNSVLQSATHLSLNPGLMEGLKYIDTWDPAKPKAHDFITRFKQKFGSDYIVTAIEADGYDGIMLLVDAMRRAGAPDKNKIRDAIHATRDWEGVRGAKGTTFSFAPDRRWAFPERGGVIRVIENNQFGRVVWSYEAK